MHFDKKSNTTIIDVKPFSARNWILFSKGGRPTANWEPSTSRCDDPSTQRLATPAGHRLLPA
jgi:hypothetical protein